MRACLSMGATSRKAGSGCAYAAAAAAAVSCGSGGLLRDCATGRAAGTPPEAPRHQTGRCRQRPLSTKRAFTSAAVPSGVLTGFQGEKEVFVPLLGPFRSSYRQ